MKRIQNIYCYGLAVVLLLCAAGCYKDKGNYTYTDVNEITVTVNNFAFGSDTSVNQADTLRITPVIEQALAKDESNLSYEWKIYDNSPTASLAAPRIIISTSRNLSVRIAEPNFSLGQRYRLTLTVKDTVTGISSIFACNVTVANRFAKGWVLLEDAPNGGDFSMLLPGGDVVHQVWSQQNPGVAMGSGKPVGLDISPMSVDDAISKGSKKIYIHNENSSLELDFQTIVKKFDIGTLFFNPPPVVKTQLVHWFSSASWPDQATLGIIINDKKVYISEIGGYPGAKKFGAALLTPNGDNDYVPAPFVSNGRDYPFIFDSKNKRFFIVRPTRLDSFPTAASTVFNMNDVKMDMLHIDEANIPRSYNAVMKDEAGVVFLLRIAFAGATPVVTSFIQQMNAPDISNMTAMASGTGSPHIFYGAGNLLYRYETTSNTTVQPFSFPAGETLINLKSGPDNQLLAATWNGTESKVYLFTVTPTGDIENNNYTDVYGGFDRIIDAAYKQ